MNLKQSLKTPLLLKCDCGMCNSQIQLLDLGDGDVDIDTRSDGRQVWHGVYLTVENKQKIIDYLNNK